MTSLLQRVTENGKRNLTLGLICLAALASFAARSGSDDGTSPARFDSRAQIECITPDGRTELLSPNETGVASASVLRDETLSCPLQQGLTTFVIKLPGAALLDRFTFVNENATASGELKISVSNYQLPAASSKWVDVDGNVTFSHKRLFNLSLLGVEARYVKLSFKVEHAGRVTSLNLYRGKTPGRPDDFASQQQFGLLSKTKPSHKRSHAFDYDFAALRSLGRVVHVSSGDLLQGERMLDDNTKTAFVFAQGDSRPTAIVELSTNERIHRVRALYKTQVPGRFDVYLLDDISKSATDLNYRQPIASATDEDGDGIAEVDFDPEGARYVAVRFSPADGLNNQPPFEIVEINAYGDAPLAMLDPTQAPDLYGHESATIFPGGYPPPAVLPIVPPVSP